MIPDAPQWVAEYGLLGLFLVTFAGATLLPLSTEIFVVAALELSFSPMSVFVVASLGNGMGATVNYLIGWLFSDRVRVRMGKSQGGRKALEWGDQWGARSLLGSWLPVIGDPLCLGAGLLRIRVVYFMLLGVGTRVIRYAVLIALYVS